MKLCIYEDAHCENFYPLTYLRPVFELKSGWTTLREKILRRFKTAQVCYFVRDWIAPTFRAVAGAPVNDMSALKGDALFVNGRLLLMDLKLELKGPEEAGVCQPLPPVKEGEAPHVAYIRANAVTVEKCKAHAKDIGGLIAALLGAVKKVEVKATIVNYPWHLIDENPKAITDDFAHFGRAGIEGKFSEHAAIWGDKGKVYIGKGASVHPFVCLDTEAGPVVIEEGAEIHPNTRIQGPAYIGPKCWILGAKIREGTVLGPTCRVGGEVEESIFHAYSNKYHDGFIGHAYVCEWVNLGALTSNSDLKNDYKPIEIYVKGELIDSQSQKVGAFFGDHTKTSIGTLLNTGTIVGIMSNLVGGSGILPKVLPSFINFINGKAFKAGFQSQLATARVAMGRRKKVLTPEDEALLKHIFELTKHERDVMVKQSRAQLAKEAGIS
jgi:UDP-N-acetylglucosamine diphosphorylase/glucosamine-1-phosphate N-acetyltransferase